MRSSSSCEGGLPKLRSHASKLSPLLEQHDHVGGRVRLEHAGHAHDAWVFKSGEGARLLEEVGAAPLECVPVALRLRTHAHGAIAVTEIDRIVFLERHRRTEMDVLGLVGDGEPAGADDAPDAVAAVENGVDT